MKTSLKILIGVLAGVVGLGGAGVGIFFAVKASQDNTQRDDKKDDDKKDEDKPSGDQPGGDTPGGDTPGGDTPGGDTPGGDTPGGDTPGGDTPSEEDKDSKVTLAWGNKEQLKDTKFEIEPGKEQVYKVVLLATATENHTGEEFKCFEDDFKVSIKEVNEKLPTVNRLIDHFSLIVEGKSVFGATEDSMLMNLPKEGSFEETIRTFGTPTGHELTFRIALDEEVLNVYDDVKDDELIVEMNWGLHESN